MKRTFKVKEVKVTKVNFTDRTFTELDNIFIQSDKDELTEVKKIYGAGSYNVTTVREFEGLFELDNTVFINMANKLKRD